MAFNKRICKPLAALGLIACSVGSGAAAGGGSILDTWVAPSADYPGASVWVEFSERSGEVHGVITKVIDPDPAHANPVCEQCSGARHNQPLLGMELVWGLKKDGDQWTHGSVLDPESGRIYNASAALDEGGAALKLHGYLGVSLLGRTEVWHRKPAALQ